MSFTRTAKAVVVSCTLAGSEQVTADLTVTFYQVQARVREPQYADDVYMVTVVKPEGVGDLIDEGGTLLEYGKFSFDSTEENRDRHSTGSRDYRNRAPHRHSLRRQELRVRFSKKASRSESRTGRNDCEGLGTQKDRFGQLKRFL